MRSIDPDYVSKQERFGVSEGSPLLLPFSVDPIAPPARGLPTTWHLLLEALEELGSQPNNLRSAANGLTSEAAISYSDFEAGSRWKFHLRSWFMHGTALVERTDDVLRKTARAYLSRKSEPHKLAKLYTGRTYRELKSRLERQRNDFLHARPSWSKGVTEDQLWEALVTFGMTLRLFLREFHFPRLGQRAKTGEFDNFVVETAILIDNLGQILLDLEEDLAANCELRYGMIR